MDLNVSKITLRPDQPSLFCLAVPRTELAQKAAKSIQDTWDALWKGAGVSDVPRLLIMAQDMTLRELTGAEIAAAGLMRVGETEA